MYVEALPLKLKKARENTGFTQREVAKETQIPQPTIARYEKGTRLPDPEKLGILADFYGVSVDWLLGTKGEQEVPSIMAARSKEAEEITEKYLKDLSKLKKNDTNL